MACTVTRTGCLGQGTGSGLYTLITSLTDVKKQTMASEKKKGVNMKEFLNPMNKSPVPPPPECVGPAPFTPEFAPRPTGVENDVKQETMKKLKGKKERLLPFRDVATSIINPPTFHEEDEEDEESEESEDVVSGRCGARELYREVRELTYTVIFDENAVKSTPQFTTEDQQYRVAFKYKQAKQDLYNFPRWEGQRGLRDEQLRALLVPQATQADCYHHLWLHHCEVACGNIPDGQPPKEYVKAADLHVDETSAYVSGEKVISEMVNDEDEREITSDQGDDDDKITHNDEYKVILIMRKLVDIKLMSSTRSVPSNDMVQCKFCQIRCHPNCLDTHGDNCTFNVNKPFTGNVEDDDDDEFYQCVACSKRSVLKSHRDMVQCTFCQVSVIRHAGKRMKTSASTGLR